MLSVEQKQFWADHGYLILPGFFSLAETDAVNRLVRRAWRRRPSALVVDDLHTHRRSSIRDVSRRDQKEHRFKLNDLYLESDALRSLCLSGPVAAILTELLGDAPVLCNTLNLEHGSEQADHVDSLYMTPLTPGHLAATWLALEDSHPDAGPLRYYPGSHRLPLYRFADGGYHAVPAEMDDWRQHVRRQIEAHGLRPEHFLARRGDLFFWHANLLHGGGPIADPGRTRRSLVSHFWTFADCTRRGLDLVPLGAGYWYRRPPQPVPPPPPRRSVLAAAKQRLRRWLLPVE